MPSTSLLIALTCVGLLIVIGLAFYAGKLLFLLHLQRKNQQDTRQKRIDSIVTSIQTIAAATTQGQCNISEASIRISRLMAAIPAAVNANYATQYPAIHELDSRLADFATHETRKNLARDERQKQDSERETHEQELGEKVLQEIGLLVQFRP